MKRALAFLLVLLQMLLLLALLILPHGSFWPVNAFVAATALVLGIVGIIVVVQGAISLGPALTASPIPREQAPLSTQGIYAVVRNPIYTGFMTAGLGLVLYGASLLHVLAWFALVWVLAGKARFEERMLMAEHPDYPDYAARVGRFVPGLGRLR